MIHFVKKKREIDIAHEGKISSIIMDFMNLWMKSVTANSKDCQRLHFCRVNNQVAHQSLLNWQLSEICTLGLAYKLVHKENDLKELLLGKVSNEIFILGTVHKLRRQKGPTDQSSKHDFCDIDRGTI